MHQRSSSSSLVTQYKNSASSMAKISPQKDYANKSPIKRIQRKTRPNSMISNEIIVEEVVDEDIINSKDIRARDQEQY